MKNRLKINILLTQEEADLLQNNSEQCVICDHLKAFHNDTVCTLKNCGCFGFKKEQLIEVIIDSEKQLCTQEECDDLKHQIKRCKYCNHFYFHHEISTDGNEYCCDAKCDCNEFES